MSAVLPSSGHAAPGSDTVVELRNVSKRFRIQEGNTLQEFVPALFRGKGFTPPFFAETRWGLPVPPETRDGLGTMFAAPNEYGLDGRAVMYHMAYFSPKVFGGGQFYLFRCCSSLIDQARDQWLEPEESQGCCQ